MAATIDQFGPFVTEDDVLDWGFVRLDDCMASDLSVVNSARVSYGVKRLVMDQSDGGLISYLMKNQHGTPFEHNAFRFHVKAPIFVFREWQRHRIGSFNELSARYTKLPEEFYIPKVEQVRVRIGKPGHYTYEQANDVLAEVFRGSLAEVCQKSYRLYEGSLVEGIAPELARLFLHVNHYSEMYWTVNARSLMNFLSLRNAPTAQWEIQQFARVVEAHFRYYMPITWGSFVGGGRVAP